MSIVTALHEIWLPIFDDSIFAILKKQSGDVSWLVPRLDTKGLNESGTFELVAVERQTVFVQTYLSFE